MLAYEVRVSYRVPLVVERIAPLRQQPEVRVISPALRRRPGDGEGPLPHVYVDRAGEINRTSGCCRRGAMRSTTRGTRYETRTS
jgi:hypothetical protein